MTIEKQVAEILLQVGAVELSPNDPFTWASGIQSPIYCDNRLTMADPVGRKVIAKGLANIIREQFPEANVVAGTATAGIPHAAWIADELELPMAYIRSTPKGHGQGRQTEGNMQKGDRAIIGEDLISTGGSSLNAAEAVKREGYDVAGDVSIFTYGLNKADDMFKEAGLEYASLTNFAALVEVAEQNGAIAKEDIDGLLSWHAQLKEGTL